MNNGGDHSNGSKGVEQKMAALTSAADRGDAESALSLAVLFLEGRVIRRDLARSRSWFDRAARLGNVRARRIHIALMANGVGGPREWLEAVEDQAKLAAIDDLASKELELLKRMELTDQGNPLKGPAVEALDGAPQIRWSRNLFTDDECALMIEMGWLYLAPSVVIDPRSGAARPDPIRTSRAAVFPWVDESPFIHALNRRIAAASRTAVEQGEPLQLLEYSPGQEYRAHSDALSGVANQRIGTALIYLNDDYVGGETHFPRLSLTLRGKRGDALIFDNVMKDGRPDPAMIHAGRPVLQGKKYLASRWIRQSEFGSR